MASEKAQRCLQSPRVYVTKPEKEYNGLKPRLHRPEDWDIYLQVQHVFLYIVPITVVMLDDCTLIFF